MKSMVRGHSVIRIAFSWPRYAKQGMLSAKYSHEISTEETTSITKLFNVLLKNKRRIYYDNRTARQAS